MWAIVESSGGKQIAQTDSLQLFTPWSTQDKCPLKVAATHEARSHVLELAGVFRGRVVDVAPESLIIEITGDEDKIDGLLEVLQPYGVLEMVRTGIVAMRRGSKCSSFVSSAKSLGQTTADDDGDGVQYSV